MKIGSRVQVIALPNDPIVRPFLESFLHQYGTIRTKPDISGDMWVDFVNEPEDWCDWDDWDNESGGVFSPQELREVTDEEYAEHRI